MDITKPLTSIDVALLKPKIHEAIDLLYDHLESETTEQIKVYCITFETPRKVYENDHEWQTLNLVYMKMLLSAGEFGEDERGKYQVFSLSDNGRKLLGW